VSKPKVAIFKFASCSGCQLVFLNCEEELLELVGALEIIYFPEAKRDNAPGPYDIAFVEGAITTPEEVERILEVRRQSKLVVAIGACAVTGGLPSLKNWKKLPWIKREVYPNPDWIDSLETAFGIDAYVRVDGYLKGCPISKDELLEFTVSALLGKAPNLRAHSVCVECKLKENVCQLTYEGAPCMGPITNAGCGALCPSNGRACYGCYGPNNDANVTSMGEIFERLGVSRAGIVRKLRYFAGTQEPFKNGAESYD
jgi:coenzyme F420-reducing hydrogenase gamma subunit